MKSNLIFYRNNESEESWLIAPKKNSLFHSLWVIFSVETALYNDTTGHVEQEKAKGCPLVYLSRGQSRESCSSGRSSVFFCSETKRKRLRRRLVV